MAKLTIKPGSTSVSLYVFVGNSSVTTGAGLTGLAYNTASLVAYYVRPLGSATAITLATQTVTGAWSSGGFVEVDATNMPGVYRLDVPDAVIATGVRSAVIMLKGAANMVPVVMEIDLNAEVNLTHWLGTAAATVDTAGYPKVTIKDGTGAGEIALTAGAIDTVAAVTTVNGLAANVLTASALAADAVTEIVGGVWDAATATYGGVGSYGALIETNLDGTVSSRASQASVDVIDDFLDTEVAAILSGTNAILVDTGTTLPAQISALNNVSAAQVKAEVVAALATDTYAEPAAVPAATASLKDKIGWVAALARNKVTQTATTQTLRNDADAADVATSTVSDDGTTAVRGKFV